MKHARIRIHTLPLLGALTLLCGTATQTQAQTKSPETVGGGTVTSPAVGPAPSFGIGGPGMVLVKNWHFGTSGTIKNYDDMDANFLYHDQFGTIGNGTNYGAVMVAHNAATALPNQPVEGTDSPPVRKFTADSLQTFLTGLDGATRVDPNKHNAGNGSFMAKWKLPNGGSLLGRDIVWETRVRCVTPPYFWFAIWTAGNKWKWNNGAAGAEQDIVESFGSDNGDDPKYKNFDGRTWHVNTVSQPSRDTVGYVDWGRGMAQQGITSYDAAKYHTWTWQYNKDNSFAMYVDGILVQRGADYHWTFGSKPTDEPIDMDFLFDGGWGHTQIGSVNHPLPVSAFDGKLYEWSYSRVYLSKDSAPRAVAFHGPHPLPGTVRAADYDTGGPTVAYYYRPAAAVPNAYRPKDAVALVKSTDTGGGYDLTGFQSGQYVKYTVNAAKAGIYATTFRVASTAPGGSFHLEDSKGANITGPIVVPNAPGAPVWSTVSATASVAAGPQTLTLVQDAPGVKLNWFKFGATMTPGLLPNGTYKLLSGKDNLGVNVSGGKTENGSGLVPYPYSGQPNEQWSLHHLGGNVYEVIGVQSGKSLTVSNGSAMISDYAGQPGQKWLISGTDGAYKIKDVSSGNLFGIGANGFSLAPDTGLPGQTWKIEAP